VPVLKDFIFVDIKL